MLLLAVVAASGRAAGRTPTPPPPSSLRSLCGRGFGDGGERPRVAWRFASLRAASGRAPSFVGRRTRRCPSLLRSERRAASSFVARRALILPSPLRRLASRRRFFAPFRPVQPARPPARSLRSRAAAVYGARLRVPSSVDVGGSFRLRRRRVTLPRLWTNNLTTFPSGVFDEQSTDKRKLGFYEYYTTWRRGRHEYSATRYFLLWIVQP